MNNHVFRESELILNDEQRIYHLNLKPEELADTIILVGDPDRVPIVSQFFDSIEHKIQKRELVTHTGYLNKRRLSVVSTGMSTANIDIVLNELDAIANIDFETRTVKSDLRSLTCIRLGTAGSLQEDIHCDTIVASEYAIDLGNLLGFYPDVTSKEEQELLQAFIEQTDFKQHDIKPYITKADPELVQLFAPISTKGITITCPGFYAPQGRFLRIKGCIQQLPDELGAFSYKDHKIANFEMETAAIYGLGQLMNHRCLSLSTILAERAHGRFSVNPQKSVMNMIEKTLEVLSSNG